MSSNTLKTSNWFFEQLEKERAAFEDESCPLLSWQVDSFAICYNLLREDAESLAKRSKQRRSERLRARTLLVDVFLAIGSEVFLLCVLAAPISKLEKISPKSDIPKIRTWWKTASHPHGLTEIATELCETYSIRTLVSSCQKRKLSEISTDKDRVLLRQGRVDSIGHDQLSESNHSQQRNSHDGERITPTTTNNLEEHVEANQQVVTENIEGQEQTLLNQSKHRNLNSWTPAVQYSLAGSPSCCFSGKVLHVEKMQTMFPRLIIMAVHGWVTTFVPWQGFTDGVIRVMVAFDQSLLRTLFGWVGQVTISTGTWSTG
jgi:hypothetical protein